VAHIFRRKTTGINYTDFTVENEVFGLDVRWTAFVYGEGLSIPEYDTYSAIQQKQTSSGLPDNLTIRTNMICSQIQGLCGSLGAGLAFFQPDRIKAQKW
jgi:hypothetical protein